MANVNAPTGLRPIGHLLGLDWSSALRRCYFASGDVNNTFKYDTVDIAGSADVTGAYASLSRLVNTSYSPGMATYPIAGVIVDFEPQPSQTLEIIYRKASTAAYALVCMDPFVIYEAQGGAYAVLAATAVGLNVCVAQVNAGSTTTGLSGLEIDTGSTSAPAANATFPLTLMGAVDRPQNDISVVNANWHVLITMHRFLPNYSNTAYFGALGVS